MLAIDRCTMKKLTLTLALLLNACAVEIAPDSEEPIAEVQGDRSTLDIRAAVVAAYEASTGHLVDMEAWNDLASMQVRLVDYAGYLVDWKHANCGEYGRWVEGGGIWVRSDISEADRKAVFVHEMLHELAHVVGGSGNSCHDDKQIFSCPESAEYLARGYLDLAGAFVAGYKCGISTCK